MFISKHKTSTSGSFLSNIFTRSLLHIFVLWYNIFNLQFALFWQDRSYRTVLLFVQHWGFYSPDNFYEIDWSNQHQIILGCLNVEQIPEPEVKIFLMFALGTKKAKQAKIIKFFYRHHVNHVHKETQKSHLPLSYLQNSNNLISWQKIKTPFLINLLQKFISVNSPE